MDTATMREQLESMDYKLPGRSGMARYSQMFNAHIDKAVGKFSKWTEIFKEMDDDCSGLLTYKELEQGLRHRLKISLADLPELDLKALWVVLDGDDSGYIEDEEFQKFIGRESKTDIPLDQRQKMLRQKTMDARAMQEAANQRDIALEGFTSSVPTWKMRVELSELGMDQPSEEDKTELAIQFTKWVAAYLPDVHIGIAWLKVFKEVDDDVSGLLTYDELRMVIRRKFKIPKAMFSEDKIKLLWVILDEDDSNSVQQIEFGRFVKRAKGKVEVKAPKQFRHTDGIDTDAPILTNERKADNNALRDEVEAAGIAVPDADGVDALSKQINEKMDEVIPGGKGWSRLFKDVDTDCSGLLTYEEFEFGIRKRLRVTHEALAPIALKALWCALDDDDSGYIEQTEFQRFMQRDLPPPIQLDARAQLVRQKSQKKRAMAEAATQRELLLEGFKGSEPTWKMRSDLEEKGYKPLTEEEKTGLAVQFAKWVMAYMPDTHFGVAWLKVFKEVDDDASGLLTFNELKVVVRQKFKIEKRHFSDTWMKKLWCTLDEDDSDSVAQIEFGRFIKRATGHITIKAPKQFRYTNDNLDTPGGGPTSSSDEKKTNNTSLLAQVQKAGVELPSEDEVKELSKRFNAKLEEVIPGGKGWNRLFKDVDVDCSGLLTYEEFELGIRQRLKVSVEDVAEITLKALWCVMDADGSGFIEQVEFQRFMQRELPPPIQLDKRSQLLRQKSQSKRAQYEAFVEREHHLEGFRGSVPTWKLRVELEEAGYAAPTQVEITALAVQFTKWVAAYMPDTHLGIAWIKVFKEVDNDNSGLLTFDELKQVVRQKFKIKKATFSDDDLKILWCAIDSDDSDSIAQIEFGRFIKLSKGLVDIKPPKQFRFTADGGSFEAHRDNKRSTAAVAEKECRQDNTYLREEVQEMGVALPDAEGVKELSRKFNQRMNEVLAGASGGKGWNRLFKDVDTDCSGLLTYEEFEIAVRHRLKVTLEEVPQINLKALWCVLDDDDSGFIEQTEFQKFMQVEAPPEIPLDKRRQLMKQKTRASFAQYEAYVEREHHLEGFKGSVATWKMRSELEMAGHNPATKDEKTDMAVQFCEWLSTYQPDVHFGIAWLKVFKEVDDDNSGLLTFDELKLVIRQKFKKTKKECPDEQIKKLWCTLDDDDSDSVQLVEFGRFIKLAKGTFVPKAIKQFRYSNVDVSTPRGRTPGTPGGSARERPTAQWFSVLGGPLYQGDTSKWDLLPRWPRGPDAPRPQTSYNATTFASRMQIEEESALPKSAEMLRAHAKIKEIQDRIDQALAMAKEQRRPQSVRGERPETVSANWRPVAQTARNDDKNLRECKENGVKLKTLIKNLMERTHHWSVQTPDLT